jgi:glycine cleavage system protein P-like pyridoxal-binding family
MDHSQFSQRSRDFAQQQAGLQSDLTNVISQLYSLSQKSFAITTQMATAIGNSFSKMNQAVGSLSNRNTHAASQQQTDAMASLNQTAQELQNAIKNMGDQGQQGQGGMPSLLQQLGNMATQQQGINQGMMPFGSSGTGQLTPQQQAELSRLLGEQQAVQKSLEQLKEETEKYGNQDRVLGDLDKISKEMQEVIEEMRNKNVDENTVQKQERILSRLLDAQRSMRERDFEKQRRSNTGQDLTRESPKDIDFNLLDNKNKLQQDLLKAIESGFAKDYETIIRKYFESIEKSVEVRN